MIERRKISNDELQLADVPQRGASWREIVHFAATFNAYQYYEEPWTHSDWSQGIPIDEYLEDAKRDRHPKKAFEVANLVRSRYESQGRWEGTLTELRAYLFTHWRELHWLEKMPDLPSLFDLLDVIRDMVAERKLE